MPVPLCRSQRGLSYTCAGTT